MGRRKKGAPAEGAEGAEEAPKEKKGNLVPAVVIAVGLVMGGKMMGGGGGGAAAAPGGEEATTTTTAAPGPVESLDAITLNLNDGHYLKMGLALQLANPEAGGGGGSHGSGAPAEEVDAKVKWAKAFDIAIEVFGRKAYPELVSPEGREAAKKELEAKLAEAYHGSVEGVYLTEFVLQ